MPYSLDTPISELFPHLFERPILFVYSDTKLVELAAYLAIGPQIYANGLLVMEQHHVDEKYGNLQGESGKTKRRQVIGRVGGRHIISFIINNTMSYSNSLYTTTAFEIMDSISHDEIEPSSPIGRIFDIFKETKFGIVPIVSKTKKTATRDNINPNTNANNITYENEDHNGMLETIALVSIRDFLPFFVESQRRINNANGVKSQHEITMSIIEIASNLTSVSKYDKLKDTIDIMLSRGIRNIGIKDQNSNLIGILNDRSILEFLYTHKDFVKKLIQDKKDDYGNGRSNIRNSDHIQDIPGSINSIISDLHISPISEIKVRNTTTIGRAAELLTDLRIPCLILERDDSIVTPWDIVIKTADLCK